MLLVGLSPCYSSFFLSIFVSQFGANSTTYVVAAETYPTELRCTCLGISAFSGRSPEKSRVWRTLILTSMLAYILARSVFPLVQITETNTGKLGALLATILFSYFSIL